MISVNSKQLQSSNSIETHKQQTDLTVTKPSCPATMAKTAAAAPVQSVTDHTRYSSPFTNQCAYMYMFLQCYTAAMLCIQTPNFTTFGSNNHKYITSRHKIFPNTTTNTFSCQCHLKTHDTLLHSLSIAATYQLLMPQIQS